MIFNDVTVRVASGTYLFEHTLRLRADGQTRKVAEAHESVDRMCLYLTDYYPKFLACRATPPDIADLFQSEHEKVLAEISRGDPLPTREQYSERLRERRDTLFSKHRSELEDVLFRVSLGGTHVGAFVLSEIQIERVNAGITELRTLLSPALDIGETDSDALHRVYAELAIFMLRNRFLASPDDPRTFQITTIHEPDLYDALDTPDTNAAAVALFGAPGLQFDTYPNTPEQEAAGVVKLKNIRLATR